MSVKPALYSDHVICYIPQFNFAIEIRYRLGTHQDMAHDVISFLQVIVS